MPEIQKPPGRVTPPKAACWVVIFVVVLVLLVTRFVIAHLIGFRFHHGTGAILLNSLGCSKISLARSRNSCFQRDNTLSLMLHSRLFIYLV